MDRISGSGRSEYLKLQQKLARANNKDFEILKVADYLNKTFKESNIEIQWNNILDMNETQLKIATYAAYKEIYHIIKENPNKNFIIDGHGKFWWNGHPIEGYHPHFLKEIKPNLCISIIDNETEIKKRLSKNEQWKDQKLTEDEILRWIADEVNIARLWSDFHGVPWYVISRKRAPTTLYMLIFHPERKRIYFAFPMTHAVDDKTTYKFQTKLALELIKVSAITDPRSIETYTFSTKQSAYSTFYRDLSWWVTQNQVVFVFYATPIPSIGAASEALEAKFQTKHVIIVWPEQKKSPFTIAAANHIFKNEKDFLAHFYKTYGKPNEDIKIPKEILDDAYLPSQS
jgi:adenylate kinase